MRTRGQAAMEFLMTYGWAILAAIIVIGVLAIYFRPSTLTTESAVVTAPLYAIGVNIASTQIQLEIQNNAGETISTTGALLSFNTPSTGQCPTVAGTGELNASQTQVITFSSCTGLADTINADVTITYRRPNSNLNLSSTGTITGKV